jgi:tetratricopeptide (TPR) repeat protein
MRISKRWRIAFVSVLVLVASMAVLSRRYIWLYLSRRPEPKSQVSDLLHDAEASKNPEALLTEANRLAWLFNWPKAEPLYIRAEQLFKENGDTRNETYSRVGRIRAQSETMSWVDVSEILGKELGLPVVKNDKKLKLWCLAAKGYTDLEINPASAKRVWTEAQGIAHDLGERELEARAKGELGFVAFLEGNTRRAAIMVGDAFLSAKASGDTGNQVRLLEMLGNGFNEAKRYEEALTFFERAIKTSNSNPDAGFPFMAYEGESQALAGQGKMASAKDNLNWALTIARANQKRGHEAMILLNLGELALQSGDR